MYLFGEFALLAASVLIGVMLLGCGTPAPPTSSPTPAPPTPALPTPFMAHISNLQAGQYDALYSSPVFEWMDVLVQQDKFNYRGFNTDAGRDVAEHYTNPWMKTCSTPKVAATLFDENKSLGYLGWSNDCAYAVELMNFSDEGMLWQFAFVINKDQNPKVVAAEMPPDVNQGLLALRCDVTGYYNLNWMIDRTLGDVSVYYNSESVLWFLDMRKSEQAIRAFTGKDEIIKFLDAEPYPDSAVPFFQFSGNEGNLRNLCEKGGVAQENGTDSDSASRMWTRVLWTTEHVQLQVIVIVPTGLGDGESTVSTML